MQDKKPIKALVLIIFSCLLLVPACTPVISEGLRKEAVPKSSFQEVRKTPDAYKGKVVIWAGPYPWWWYHPYWGPW